MSVISRAVLAAVLVGLLATAGCSFVLVSGPPSQETQQELAVRHELPTCTATVGAPVADLLLTLATLVAAGSSYNPNGNEPPNNFDVKVFGTAGSLLFAASAIYGFVQVNRCQTFMSKSPLSPPALKPRSPALPPTYPAPDPSANP